MVSTSLRIAGWAMIDTATTTTGVDAVHVWAYPVAGGGPIFVGATTTFVARPDVAAILGGEFLMSGFDFTGSLPAGTYDLAVFVRNATTGQFDQWRVVRITVN